MRKLAIIIALFSGLSLTCYVNSEVSFRSLIDKASDKIKSLKSSYDKIKNNEKFQKALAELIERKGNQNDFKCSDIPDNLLGKTQKTFCKGVCTAGRFVEPILSAANKVDPDVPRIIAKICYCPCEASGDKRAVAALKKYKNLPLLEAMPKIQDNDIVKVDEDKVETELDQVKQGLEELVEDAEEVEVESNQIDQKLEETEQQIKEIERKTDRMELFDQIKAGRALKSVTQENIPPETNKAVLERALEQRRLAIEEDWDIAD